MEPKIIINRTGFDRKRGRISFSEPPPAIRFLHPFTLIELLVVIGVIAILASLLLPALRKAKDEVNHIACVSNLRQIAVAATGYATDNNEYGPDKIVDDGATRWNGNGINSYVSAPASGLARISDCPLVRCPGSKAKTITASSPGCVNGNGDLFTNYSLVFGHGDGTTFAAGAVRDDLVAKSGFYTNEGKLAPVQNFRQLGTRINVRDTTFLDAQPANKQPLAACAIQYNTASAVYYSSGNPTLSLSHSSKTPSVFMDGHTKSMMWNQLYSQRIPVNNSFYMKFRYNTMLYADK